jgi:hypothetical protein
MPNGTEPYSLLAMTPAGEAAFVRDDRQRIWLIKFAQHYQQKLVTLDEVETAVNKYGWEQVDVDFPSWDDLDNYRLQRAAEGLDNLPDPEVADYDRSDVEVILKQAATAGPERRADAEKLLTDLVLRCRAVRTDDELAAKVAEQLDAIRQPPSLIEQPYAQPSKYGDRVERMDLDHGLVAA